MAACDSGVTRKMLSGNSEGIRYHQGDLVMEEVEVEELKIQFKADTSSVGGFLKFNCKIEYPSTLDPFLPSELKKQTDWKGSVIMPFSGGQGGFTANTLEQAESLEAELKAKLQGAYEGLLEWKKRVGQWGGVREYALVKPDQSEDRSSRGI
jgi:hypothetical protein